MKIHAKRRSSCVISYQKTFRNDLRRSTVKCPIPNMVCKHVEEEERMHGWQTNIKVQQATGKWFWREWKEYQEKI